MLPTAGTLSFFVRLGKLYHCPCRDLCRQDIPYPSTQIDVIYFSKRRISPHFFCMSNQKKCNFIRSLFRYVVRVTSGRGDGECDDDDWVREVVEDADGGKGGDTDEGGVRGGGGILGPDGVGR